MFVDGYVTVSPAATEILRNEETVAEFAVTVVAVEILPVYLFDCVVPVVVVTSYARATSSALPPPR